MQQIRSSRRYVEWLLLLAVLLAVRVLPAQTGPPLGAGTATLLPVPPVVPLVGPLTLGVQLRGAALVGKLEFPDLEGFRKGNQARTTTTRLLPGGGHTTELTLTQRYLPYAEGDYQVPPFDLTVNGQTLHSPGGRVRVGAGPTPPPADANVTTPLGTGIGSLDQLLGKPKPKNFYEPRDYAFLALEADQARVYVGQGVRVRLYLYLRPADQALLNFYDFNGQLTEMLRQLRQPSTWQVPAEAATLPDTVRRAGGQVYLRFRLAESAYYPLTAQPLSFPALALTMIKFRLLKKPQPGDTERLAMYKTYAAEPLAVAVRPLPTHAGRAADSSTVAVGDYVLHEGISSTSFHTGEAFTYTFGVEGRGNSDALQPPRLLLRAGLEVYGPDIRLENLPDGRLRKNFRYRIVALHPGPVLLDNLFQLPFFNPLTARYDTLRAELRPVVQGASLASATAAQPTDDPFYGPALAHADTRLQPLDVYEQVDRYAAWLVGALLAVAAWGWWRSGATGS